MNLTIKIFVQSSAALMLASLLSLDASAQPGGAPSSRMTSARGARSDPARVDPARSELEREMMLRETEESLNGSRDRRQAPRASFAQIADDFMRLQVVNNELVLAASRPDELNLKFVAKSASEIKKRAERLKFTLALPAAPEGETKHPKTEAEAVPEQLRSSLTTLGKLIAGFAHNPVFKEANVVDARLSAKARRDLEEIIELSGQVKKSSEKLNKAVQKSQ